MAPQVFHENRDHQRHCHHDGEEAFVQFVVNFTDYDAIILDLMLPGRSGTDICMSLRERNIVTPIIILTAREGLADKIALLNAGADDYIEKPFAFDELLARIRAVTRRPPVTVNDELIYHNLRVICSQRRAFVGNEELVLS